MLYIEECSGCEILYTSNLYILYATFSRESYFHCYMIAYRFVRHTGLESEMSYKGHSKAEEFIPNKYNVLVYQKCQGWHAY